ncbi:MAG TPA: hypothetical protein VKB38_01690 [Terracidiphilus sp.]|nr:hypothetical protein [Terracidiphilus sp.]
MLTASVAVLAAGLSRFARPVLAQEVDGAELIRRIDATNQTRYEHVQEFTDKEHYAVFRGADKTKPSAEMTVQTTYRKGVGKDYNILSRSGSGLIQKFGLQPLLDNEKEINDPTKVQNSWIISANYEMRAQPDRRQQVDGRDCVAVEIKPKRKAPNMIDGTLWVDPANGAICEVEGIASQKPSAFAGTTHMMRRYRLIDGYAMATHARAESGGMFGHTVVTIDYSDYRLRVLP